MHPQYQQFLEHIAKTDSTLHSWAIRYDLEPIATKSNLFEHLCADIIGQQLSIKVADVIWARFVELLRGKQIEPKTVLALSPEQIRTVGTSNAKAKSILDLAARVHDGRLHLDKIRHMTDQNVMQELVAVKGIGPWTAEMFLIFSLGRPDVFSPGDTGLQRGMQIVYGLSEVPDRDWMLSQSAKWSPYRSFGSRVLWKVLLDELK